MSQSVIDAIYEHGSLRLIDPDSLPLQEGQRVRLVVSPEPDVLQLAAEVYAGLSEEEIGQVESIALNRKGFFDRRSDP
jgi:predicted DNA-binding antitoxin AbrB/MazE fold protein